MSQANPQYEALVASFIQENALNPVVFTQTVRENVQDALQEDGAKQDHTAALVAVEKRMKARVLVREDAVICGIPWAMEALKQMSGEGAQTLHANWLVQEGQAVHANDYIVEITGPARTLLAVERTVLNFLQMQSAVATKTAQYVAAVAGTQTRIVDTRKTLPGLRIAQKYAVHVGGGKNHRLGLNDAILIKENHIASAGGVAKILQHIADKALKLRFVMIEVETLNQLKEALDAGAKMILLDNMDIPTLRQAVALNNTYGSQKAVLENSGGVQLASVRQLAETGVDRISIGALTKDVKATDFSMRFTDI